MTTLKAKLVVACLLLNISVAAHASPYVVTLQEVGPNVVANGSGQIDLTGLSLAQSGASCAGGLLPQSALIAVGSGLCDEYTGTFSGPSNFGPGGVTVADSDTGGIVAIGFDSQIYVPTGYVSNADLGVSTATFDNASFGSLGVTPGTYIWTWGTAADQSLTLEIGTPATLPLFLTGLGALGLLGWRRKRKAQAA